MTSDPKLDEEEIFYVLDRLDSFQFLSVKKSIKINIVSCYRVNL